MRYLRPYYASGENPNSPHIIVRDPDDRAVVSCASDILLQAHPSITDNLRAGEQRSVWIVSHQGTSQYRFFGAGQTSCGLCASNFVRQVFKRYISGTTGRDLLRWLLSRECTTEITDIAQYYRHSVYLEVANIVGAPSYQRELGGGASYIEEAVSGLPYFTEALIVDTPTDNIKCSYSSFLQLLNTMDEKKEIAAAIITQPPEIIAAMKIPNPTSKTGIFVIFDSHGHTDLGYPQSSGIIICHRPEDAAAFLAARQPVQDELQRQVLAASFVRPKASLARISEKAQQRSLMLSMNMLNNEIGKTIQSKSSPPKVSDTHHRPRTLQVTQSQAEIGEAMRENLEINLDTANQQIKELKQQLQSQNTEIAKANEITNSAIAKAKEIEQKMTEMEKSARQSESNAPKVSDTPQRRRPRTLQVTESQAEIGEAIVENLKANLKNTDQRVKELEQQLESQKIAARKEIAKANEITNNAIARANEITNNAIARANEIEQKMTEMEKSARQSESNAPKVSDTPQRRRPRTLQVTESQAEIGEAIVENLKANLENTDQRVKELEQRLKSQKIAARKEIAKANEITKSAIARANEIEQKMTEMEKFGRRNRDLEVAYKVLQKITADMRRAKEEAQDAWFAAQKKLIESKKHAWALERWVSATFDGYLFPSNAEDSLQGGTANHTPGSQSSAKLNNQEQPAPHRSRDKMTSKHDAASDAQKTRSQQGGTPNHTSGSQSSARFGKLNNHEQPAPRTQSREELTSKRAPASDPQTVPIQWDTRTANHTSGSQSSARTDKLNNHGQLAPHTQSRDKMTSKRDTFGLDPQKTPPQSGAGRANHASGSQSSARTGKLNKHEQPAPHAQSRDEMTSVHDASASNAQKTPIQWDTRAASHAPETQDGRIGELNHVPPAADSQSRDMHQISTTAADPFDRTKEPQFSTNKCLLVNPCLHRQTFTFFRPPKFEFE
ncbi:hypothetical protein H2248_011394 [Termitomyces sp. 'cryptogamus']|nr:hypothetical protein H2248_011394 [Termitomyces sp. 'cryptogamus']